MKLKCSLHAHSNEEPHEWIWHDARELIEEAKHKGFDVLAFTCHDYFFQNEELSAFAAEQGILLIPGIEKTISKRHVLILNANKGCEKINTFDQLKDYKKANPNILIIAPHPYFPGQVSLGPDLEQWLKLFDAIELAHFHHPYFDRNRTARSLAERHSLPLIATGDLHMIEQLDTSYCYLQVQEKSVAAVIDAIKSNRIRNHNPALTLKGILLITVKLLYLTLRSYVKNIRHPLQSTAKQTIKNQQ